MGRKTIMTELFKTLEILESILRDENPVKKAREHRQAVIAEIEALEQRMYQDLYDGETAREDCVF